MEAEKKIVELVEKFPCLECIVRMFCVDGTGEEIWVKNSCKEFHSWIASRDDLFNGFFEKKEMKKFFTNTFVSTTEQYWGKK